MRQKIVIWHFQKYSFLKIFGFNYRFDKVWPSVSTVKYDALEMSKNVFNFTRAPEPHYARFS
jgi:hypothetical protein